MNFSDIIVLTLIALSVVLSIIFIKRKKSCCGDCRQCRYSKKCK